MSIRRSSVFPRRWPNGVAVIGLLLALVGCGTPPSEIPEPSGSSHAPRESAGTSVQPGGDPGEVAWTFETPPLPSDRDAADDPAIWVDPQDPARSVIIGTDKKGDHGLVVYDLSGAELQSVGDTSMNNVDVRPRVLLGGDERVVVVASTIEERSLEVFTLDPETRTLGAAGAAPLDTGIRASGVCLYQPSDDTLFVVVSAGNGSVQQWALTAGNEGIEGELARELRFESQVEGCVADDATGRLYVSEETRGIWSLSADPSAADDRELIDTVGGAGGLEADIEGLAIARYDDGAAFLVASSQGNDRFVVYRLDGSAVAVAGSFHVTGTEAHPEDEVTHTDGIEVTLQPLGPPPFDHGLLMVQDDDNEEPGGATANQNFKAIAWGSVEGLLGIP
jgi:3-phytase